MPRETITDWGVASWTAFTAGLAGFYSFLPNLLGAIIILLIGWGVASLLYTLTDKLLDAVHFDRWMARAHVDEAINRSGVHIDPSNLLATLVKWIVWLVAIMMAAEQLGLAQVSLGIAAIIGYIPNVIAAVVILTLGLVFANFVSRLVRSAASSAGIRTTELLSNLSYWAIVVFAVLGAIGQLNIAPALVQTLYTAVIAAVALAGALAFGLGMRQQAEDVVAGRAVAEQLHEGDEISVGELSGAIASIGTLKTMLRTRDGLISVPNRMLTTQIVRMRTAGAMAGGGGGATQTPSGQSSDVASGNPSEMPASSDLPRTDMPPTGGMIEGEGTRERPWRVEPSDEEL